MASILLGNIKGPQGNTGATGPKGDTGNAATVSAGSVTTVPYGQNARVTNSGDEHEAIFDFVIPQGRPGEQTTDMENLTLSSMTEPSAQFPIPSIGDTGKVIFGKITKWFSDMSALVATKFPTSNVVNNLTTTASGYALDARQGKALNDKITTTTDVTGVANTNNVTGTCSGKKRGYMVTLSVDFVAAKDLTSSGWTLFTGLPVSVTQARTTMYNVTKNQPISIGVNTAGNLVMMYAGSLSTGDAVKGGITYITSE